MGELKNKWTLRCLGLPQNISPMVLSFRLQIWILCLKKNMISLSGLGKLAWEMCHVILIDIDQIPLGILECCFFSQVNIIFSCTLCQESLLFKVGGYLFSRGKILCISNFTIEQKSVKFLLGKHFNKRYWQTHCVVLLEYINSNVKKG